MEFNYAMWLTFIREPWEFEPKTFWFEKIKRGVRSYKPDFWLPQRKEWHEVKGWMDPRSATKLNRMRIYYPQEKIILIQKDFFDDIERKGLCRLIPNWECKHTIGE